MRRDLAVLLPLAAAAVLVAGCGGAGPGANKAGGTGPPVVLRMADAYNPDLELEPAVKYFARRLRDLSGGTVRVRVVEDWGEERSTAEQQVVRDVAAGKAELGWVGTRIFDTLGVSGFQALTAPMLIDSYALERAVIESDLPDRMLPGLDRLGVKGLAVLSGGLRRPIASDRPLLHPADWRGITFAVFHSRGQELAIRALRARPTNLWGTFLQDAVAKGRIDGFEKSYVVWPYVIGIDSAPYVTANVNLWPETVALLANPDRLSGLSDEQRGWVREAARDAAARSTGFFADEAPLMRSLCKQGARFSNATPADLASLRRAFAPVYDELELDPQTGEFVDRIEQLKAETKPTRAAAIPTRCTGPAAVPFRAPVGRSSPAVLNGVYRLSWTDDELLARGPAKVYSHVSYGVITLTLRNGSYRFNPQIPPACTGTYRVAGQVVTIRPQPAPYCQGVVTARWSRQGSTLRLRVLRATDPGEPIIWGGKPWRKIG